MKKTRLLVVLSALLLGSLVVTQKLNNEQIVVKAANDVSFCNGDVPASEAVEINYSGTRTDVYGMQAYAGFAGPAWVLGEGAIVLDQGHGSHVLGSNDSDGRSGLQLTFKVNSSVAGNAFLGLYGRFNGASNCTLAVNGGEAVNHNLMRYEWVPTVPTLLPVTLQEGSNTIVLTMGNNYTAWFQSFYISNSDNWLKDDHGHNDTYHRDGNAFENTAVTVPFTGEVSPVYGIQSYAGVKGPAWVVGHTAPVLEDGSYSHPLGSNASDGRSGLELTFQIDSELAVDAYLNLYAEYYDNVNSKATLDVNGQTSSINFFELNGNSAGSSSAPTKIPVTLAQGLNTIKITMQDNYTIWANSWSVTPQREILPKHNQIGIGSWTNKQGSITADGYAIGLNAFDNAADYGKTGSVDYKFTCERVGDYYMHLGVMCGNPLSNRLGLTINGETYMHDGKPYIALDASGGWTYVPQTYKISLAAGEKMITMYNVLTNVNAERTQEVPEGTEGSVKVSNWWINSLKLERVPSEEIIIDTSACQTMFNINRPFTAEGLKVSYKLDDEVTVLNPDQYVIDSSKYTSEVFGSYEISVYKKDSNLSAKYSVVVGDNGTAFEGKTVEFDGNYTGATTHSFYNYAKIEGEGTDDCAGRLFWYTPEWKLNDGGFQFGSNGAGANENRQVTLTVTIDSSVAGNYLFKAGILSENRANSTLKIKVNDEEEYDASLFYSSVNLPYLFEVNLKEGINTVKFTTYNQYAHWFNYFELCPIEYKELGYKAKANEGARWGKDLIDADANDIWAANIEKRALTYYYAVENDGKYLLNLSTNCSGEKKAKVYVDGTAYDLTVVNGVSKLPVALTAGNHTFKILAEGGAESEFGLTDVQLVKDIKPVGLVLDTSNATLTIPYDGILDTTTISAQLKYDDDSLVDLSTTEWKIVKDPEFSETKAGSYEFKVVYTENEEIFATFIVVVLEEEKQPSDNPSTEPSEQPSEEPSEEPSTEPSDVPSEDPVPQEPTKKGCKGSTAGLIGLITLAGALILKRNKK